MIVKKEIEIDLPDGVAEKWEPVAFRWKHMGWGRPDGPLGPLTGELVLAPKREPLVTRIARAVIAGECGFTPAMERIEWIQDHWNMMCGPGDWWSARFCGPIPPHEPGDPETVLVADINAEVERLREGGET